MDDSSFNPERWDHWLVVIAFLVLSSWILWKVHWDS